MALDPKAEPIARAYAPIIAGLFRIDPPDDFDLNASIIELCDEINAFDGDTEDWVYIGEFVECTVSDFLIGAYWALTEWHGGQYSDSYAAMCAIGTIFSPGMTSGPESESCEYDAYEAVGAYFETMHPTPTE